MSFLAPLFLIGAGLLALPILFHLIRRQPKNSIQFSSLLFLRPSPPRLTRRSRLDNWFLLLLRALALALIVLAFARPFLRQQSQTVVEARSALRVIVVDRSASMQRDDLWIQAQSQVAEAIAAAGAQDQLALVTFAEHPQVVQDFTDGAGDAVRTKRPLQLPPSLQPTWEAGNLGEALVFAANLLAEAAIAQDAKEAEQEIVLVSDLQSGSSLSSLLGFAWPEDVVLKLRPVTSPNSDNATLAVAGEGVYVDEETGETSYRVSLTNSTSSKGGSFKVAWIDAAGNPVANVSGAREVAVPPGATRVVKLTLPPPSATAIRLEGDHHSFDNTHYVVVPKPLVMNIPFIGKAISDPRKDPFYYLDRVVIESPNRKLNFEFHSFDAEDLDKWAATLDPQQTPSVFLHWMPAAGVLETLANYAMQGGRIIAVVDGEAAQNATTRAGLATVFGGESIDVAQAQVDDYSIMTRVDFDSHLFRTLADPRFNDFSKIQFWQHQVIKLQPTEGWSFLASFDDGSPAILRKRIGEGEGYILSFGWQPEESQFALSSKFIPFVAGLVESRTANTAWDRYLIGASPTLSPSPQATVTTPTGDIVEYATAEAFSAVDKPGIYKYRDLQQERLFVANVSPAESETTPLDGSELERLGVRLSSDRDQTVIAENERQMRDRELEQQQQWWRALLLTALGLLFIETLLSTWKRVRIDTLQSAPGVATSIPSSTTG